MPLPRRRWTRLLGGVLALLGAATARGQFSGQSTAAGAATFRPGGLREGLTTTSLDATPNAQLGGAGTVESSLVRDADAAQETFFRSFQNGILRIPKLGYGQGRLNISAPLGPMTGFSVFGFAPKPEDAEFKLGNFYLDLFSLSGSVLWSDNINLREVGKESEEIAVVRMRGALMYQVNEAMRLSAAGTAVWLPFEQELGFTDPIADYTYSLAPIFQTQFIYDIPFNKVDVQMIENFTVQSGGFGTGRAFDLLGREAGDLEDRAGRYAFRDTQAQGPTDRRFRSAPSYRNVIGANVSSLLPTVTRLTFGYAHETSGSSATASASRAARTSSRPSCARNGRTCGSSPTSPTARGTRTTASATTPPRAAASSAPSRRIWSCGRTWATSWRATSRPRATPGSWGSSTGRASASSTSWITCGPSPTPTVRW